MAKKLRTHFPNKLELRDSFSNETADVYLYDHFAVVEAKEGVTLSFKTGFTLLLKGLNILGTKPWVYISNRVNSYAVVPTDYKYLNSVPSLKGLAIVNPNKAELSNAHLEKAFFKKPFTFVKTIDEAYDWGKEILDKH